jgi:hypothetical protein
MRAHLLSEIIAVLNQIGAASPMLVNRASTDKVYEIFVWSCVLRALAQIGATMEARDSNDTLTTQIDFRLAPGLIYSPTTAPGFVLIDYNGKKYELQNGLRVLGSSKVLHELDVCILDRSHTARCRNFGIDADSSAVRFLAECKYYGNNLPLHLGREFLGLGSEFSIRVKTIVANMTSSEVHTLVKRHRGTTHFELTSANQQNVDQFIGWLATELKHAL